MKNFLPLRLQKKKDQKENIQDNSIQHTEQPERAKGRLAEGGASEGRLTLCFIEFPKLNRATKSIEHPKVNFISNIPPLPPFPDRERPLAPIPSSLPRPRAALPSSLKGLKPTARSGKAVSFLCFSLVLSLYIFSLVFCQEGKRGLAFWREKKLLLEWHNMID